MDPFKPRNKHGPEFYIQDLWVGFLEGKGWLVERLVGNAFQSGIPDIYIGHLQHGTRWIDIKVYGKYNFTKAQKQKWPEWEKFGIPIWILGAESREACTLEHMIEEYELLFGKPNWRQYWKSSWDKQPDIDKLLDECDKELENEANDTD